MNNVIHINKYKNSFKKKKMLLITIISGIILGNLIWKYFIQDIADLDIQIPSSNNITFNDKTPEALTTAQLANYFEINENKPILLYIYTTWCKVCHENFTVINELSREFQNTNLKIIAIAIDKELNADRLKNYLNNFGNLYFEPKFLIHKEGFIDFLKKQNVKYNHRIPFTILFSKNSNIITKYSGTKNKNHLRNKIIKELFSE